MGNKMDYLEKALEEAIDGRKIQIEHKFPPIYSLYAGNNIKVRNENNITTYDLWLSNQEFDGKGIMGEFSFKEYYREIKKIPARKRISWIPSRIVDTTEIKQGDIIDKLRFIIERGKLGYVVLEGEIQKQYREKILLELLNRQRAFTKEFMDILLSPMEEKVLENYQQLKAFYDSLYK